MTVRALRIEQLIDDVVLNDSDKTFTVGAGEEWELLSLWAELITTATAGNRQLTVEIDDGADLVAVFDAGVVQAASLTRRYLFGRGLPKDTAAIGTRVLGPLAQLILPAGYRIRIFDSAAIDAAADDLTVRALGLKRHMNA